MQKEENKMARFKKLKATIVNAAHLTSLNVVGLKLRTEDGRVFGLRYDMWNSLDSRQIKAISKLFGVLTTEELKGKTVTLIEDSSNSDSKKDIQIIGIGKSGLFWNIKGNEEVRSFGDIIKEFKEVEDIWKLFAEKE